jgi:hypothetical protein
MGKTSTERQHEYRQRNIRDVEATKSRLSIVISDHAMLALKRLAKHAGCTQVALLERVLLEEQGRILDEMTDKEAIAFHDSVTV